ncbi:hypothetical protein CPC735_016360 [Coccidioides posadasii C735 delta SOWgp]|uniref:Vacuolar membrane protein n=2 Tax=Coccidioides posadasii TaxID=199306 RepID=A0A0J6IIZ1_COCPO|nr:hypothetical protein CPC735_016360 [Coccidioides posadasii C735 delta SOWgp]EER25035.1 hypothetical protein CPC735_016360 [Coccidioides posadasii C735 delta SOWgp]KMM71852.1 vacuolar membrane protein [Coccidioides posadasii RMSCC 3488]|eukprot:XP_003067180.1 hypothetical protein CPC735_016360 [Coccidioides posadasii C735 delta SOWgp]
MALLEATAGETGTSAHAGHAAEEAVASHGVNQEFPSQETAYQPCGKPTVRRSPFGGIARHTLGVLLLLIVVFLWTTSNFLASTIFADNTYSKPFFVTYLNTAVFTLPLIPYALRRGFQWWKETRANADVSHQAEDGPLEEESHPFLSSENEPGIRHDAPGNPSASADGLPRCSKEVREKLDFRATARLSLQFCLLWFAANYFAYACLQYTTVGSTTILTSTSGVWTLIFGATLGVEKFTARKLFGVIASLTGIIIISRVDLSGSNDENRGSFPYKSPAEIAIGDAMAAFSAILYGVYIIVMKKRVGDESRVSMALFFGLVGLWNTFIMWPGFFILHFTGLEPFAWPDSHLTWTIIRTNAIVSLASDICWAYAMLLTTPLVVTVGLSMTIPLSLIAQIFIHGQYSTVLYWIGAAIVFLSFIFVNHESKTEAE